MAAGATVGEGWRCAPEHGSRQTAAVDPHAPPPPSVAACIALYRAGKPLAWGCPADTPNRAVERSCTSAQQGRTRAIERMPQEAGGRYTAAMSLPTDPAAPELPLSPRRVLMESPLAVAGWIRSRRLQREGGVTMRGQRWIALFGTLLMHMVFLAIFVLGPPYDWEPPQSEPEQYLQVRLIEADELPPPPPPAPNTLPKQLGPRHQGRAATAAATTPSRAPGAGQTARPERSAAASAPLAPTAPSPQAAPVRRPVAAPLPSVSLPTPAPMPQLQPVPLAGQPPSVALAMPSLQPPAPPKFQPQPVRPVRDEGQQPVLPPPSLALPEVPAATLPPVMTPSIALRVEPPRMDTPASVSALRAQVPAAPPVPDMQPVPLPAATCAHGGAAGAIERAGASRCARCAAGAGAGAEDGRGATASGPGPSRRRGTRQHPARRRQDHRAGRDRGATHASHHAGRRATRSAANRRCACAAATHTVAATRCSTDASAGHCARDARGRARLERPTSAPAAAEPDVSTAPDATPQGRDDAVLGSPAATATSTPGAATGAASARAAGAPSNQATGDHEQGPGKLAGQNLPQTNNPARRKANAAARRAITSSCNRVATPRSCIAARQYRVQAHAVRGRWTPYGESSLDTALRRAVEKTTVEHTFHCRGGFA